MQSLWAIISAITLLLPTIAEAASARSYLPSHVDETFSTSLTGDIMTLAVDADDRIWVGGWLSLTNAPATNLVRLLPNGTIDPAFASAAGANGIVRKIRALPDGSALVMGEFSEINGLPRNGIARFSSDGALASPVWTNSVKEDFFDAHQLPDGSLIAASYSRLLWILPDGSADTNFITDFDLGFGDTVLTILPVGNNQLLLGLGGLVFVDSQPFSWGLARISLDGKIDRSFKIDELSYFSGSAIRDAHLLADGSYLVAGDFDSIQSVRLNSYTRVRPDGSVDPAFGSGIHNAYALEVQPDGKILIGGFIPFGNIFRYLPDGQIDTSFYLPSRANHYIYDIALQSDGKILAGGTFTDFNGQFTGPLVRLRGGDALEVPAEFTVQPEDETLYEGRSLRLAAEADGWPVPSFQWQFEGGDIPGATSNVLTVADMSLQQSGRYWLLASNSSGVVTSRVATVEVRPSPVAPGRLDLHRNPSASTSAVVNVFLRQADGGVIMAGSGPIRRLDSNLRPDTNFANPQVTGTIHALVPWTGDSFIAAGSFTKISNVSISHLAKFDRDGHLDTNFNLHLTSAVRAAIRDPQGNLLLAGAGGALLTRFFPDGRRDDDFQINTTASIIRLNALALTPEADILLGGQFSLGAAREHNGLAKFNQNGVLDTAFKPLGPNSEVTAILPLQDGRILIDGQISAAGQTRGLTMLHANGSVDDTFQRRPRPDYIDIFKKILRLNDGRFLICHGPTPIVDGITLLLSNGAPDTNFVSSAYSVRALLENPDGSLLLGGYFQSVDAIPRYGVAILHGYPDRILPMPRLTANELSFEHRTFSGYNYTLQSSTNLLGGNWSTITNYPGDGRTNRWTLPPTGAQNYYRLTIDY